MNKLQKLDADYRADLKAIYEANFKNVGKVRDRLINESGVKIETVRKWERNKHNLSFSNLSAIYDWVDENK